HGIAIAHVGLRELVERPAERVDDPPEQRLPDPHARSAIEAHHAVSGADAGHAPERRRDEPPATEADHLEIEPTAGHLQDVADASLQPAYFDQKTHDFDDDAGRLMQRRVLRRAHVSLEGNHGTSASSTW